MYENGAERLLDINIDIERVVHRGDSVRTRYFGELKGVNPELRKIIYDKQNRAKLLFQKCLKIF
jgi:hypothetical protein